MPWGEDIRSGLGCGLVFGSMLAAEGDNGGAAGTAMSDGSESGASPGSSAVCHFERLSSQVRYRCKLHIPCSAPVSRAEAILKKSRVRMKFFTAWVAIRISHSGTRIFCSGRKRRRCEMAPTRQSASCEATLLWISAGNADTTRWQASAQVEE